MEKPENIESGNEEIIINLKAKLWELEDKAKDQENEIICYQRRLWKQWEDMIDLSHVMDKIKDEIGAERLEEIYDDYVKNEKSAAIKHQRNLAETCEYGIDLEALIGSEN